MLEAQINHISETFNKGVVGLIEIGIAARKEAIDRIASQDFPQAVWVDILQSLNGVEMTASNAPLLIVANLEDYYALDMPSDSSKTEREAAIEALKAMSKSEYNPAQSRHKTPIAARTARIERRRKANKAAKVSRRKNRKP